MIERPAAVAMSRTDLDGRLADLVAEVGIPGAVLGVATPAGTHIATAGTLNRRTGFPVTADTLFEIGSITKLFTATAVLRLVDLGCLGLDDPVVAHVPEFRLADGAAGRGITVRHLLTHTSGVPSDHFELFGRGDDCLERFTADLARLAPEAEPGEVFSYSNGGFSLLGRLVERVTGQVYDAALRDLVLDPLGLPVATLLPEQAILHAVAVGHRSDPAGGPPKVTPVFSGASRALGPEGYLMLPVGELLRFATRIGELLRPETLAEAWRPQADVLRTTRSSTAWGLGWRILVVDPVRIVGHDGNIGAQTAWLRVVPERGIAVVLLANLDLGSRLDEVARTVVGPVLAELCGHDGVPAVPPGSPPLARPDRYVGRYARLNVDWTVTAGPEGRLTAAIAYGESWRREGRVDVSGLELVPVERDVFALGHADGPTIVFEGLGEGPATSVHAALRALRRISA